MDKNNEILAQRSLVLVKPDGVMRGIVGEVISRFERSGLKLVGLKLIQITPEFADKHQPSDEGWIKGLGNNTLKDYKEAGLDVEKDMGTIDPLEIGKLIRDWNTNFLTSGPVVAMVWEGNEAIGNIRKMVGNTLPIFAAPGTIRGDFSTDSPILASVSKRSVRNVVHASGDPEEAKNEVSLWFAPEEIHSYKRADWAAMFEAPKN